MISFAHRSHRCRHALTFANLIAVACAVAAQAPQAKQVHPASTANPASTHTTSKGTTASPQSVGPAATQDHAVPSNPEQLGADQSSPDTAEPGILNVSPLKITLTPSETPLKIGSTSNIAADIQNVSTKPIELDTNAIQLMVHAILSQTDSLCVLPLAPTTNTYLMGILVLQPQDHLSVLFNLSQKPFTYTEAEAGAIDQALQKAGAAARTSGTPGQVTYQRIYQQAYLRSCNPNFFGPLERAIDFTPGNYEYFLTGKFSECDPANLALCPYPTRSFAQSEKFQVGIDQVQIIIFAVIGGLLAYLVVAVRGDDGAINKFFGLVTAKSGDGGFTSIFTRDGIVLGGKLLRDVIGVAILSSAFTIVSSRLSDSQFPIKVSVLDGWGAITIGFLSYFVGNKFIDSLRNMVR